MNDVNRLRKIFSYKTFTNKPLYQFLVIGIVPFLLYVRTTGYGFIGLDDTLLIIENRVFLSDLSNMGQAFRQDVFQIPGHPDSNAYYRPLLTISFMLDAQIGKTSPAIYHFTNVVMHMIVCLLLLEYLRLMKIEAGTAFFLALVFSVHPVLTQAVGWIAGRNDILVTIFVLSSFINFILYREREGIHFLVLHFLFFTMALFTKEVSVFLPVFVIYYLIVLCREKFFKVKYFSIIPVYGAVGICWFLLRQSALAQHGAYLSPKALAGHLAHNYIMLFQYLSKILVPWKLAPVSTVKDTNYYLSGLALLVITTGILLSKNRNWKKVCFGVSWYVLFMLPSLLVPGMTGFEHRVYLPMIGILVVISAINLNGLIRNRNIISITAVCIIALFTILNIKHAPTFKNSFNFWKKAAENSEHSAMACLNYGVALAKKDLLDEAIKVYQRGIRANPYERMIHNNLAIVYARKKMYAEAEKEFVEEIKINPRYSEAYYNLGILYNSHGNITQAMQMWEKTLELNPGHKLAREKLEILLRVMGINLKINEMGKQTTSNP